MLAIGLAMLTVAAAGAQDGRSPHYAGAGGVIGPDGAALFRTYCACCHGTDAIRSGPAATAMKVVPADLTRIALHNHGMLPAERVRQIIQGKGPAAHGDRNMPVWGDIFKRRIGPEEPHVLVDALVRYLDGVQERPAE
jgi:mono/diheme cytochrome c family protein